MLLTESIVILKTIVCKFYHNFVFQYQSKLFNILSRFQKEKDLSFP